ncbi:hypothetical protein U1Q18_023138, partial [Sarracenia purpurea var. burkii]
SCNLHDQQCCQLTFTAPPLKEARQKHRYPFSPHSGLQLFTLHFEVPLRPIFPLLSPPSLVCAYLRVCK